MSPCVFYDAGFSSLQRRRGDGGQGKLFQRVLAWRKLAFRLDVLVNQLNEKDCEPHVFIGGSDKHWDPNWRDGRCVVLLQSFVLQASVEAVCAE